MVKRITPANKDSNTDVYAFTQLCEKVNISIFDRTMTFYPKLNGVTQYYFRCSAESLKPINDAWEKLGEKEEIYHYHERHKNLHKDNFSRNDWHGHIEFKGPLNEAKLNKILTEFIVTGLITADEKDRFIIAYRLANKLNKAEFDKALAEIYLQQLKESIEKKYAGSDKKGIMSHAKMLVQNFEQLIDEEESLSQTLRYIKETQLVIEHPTKANVTKLHRMGVAVQKSQSSTSQAMGVTLISFSSAMALIGLLGSGCVVSGLTLGGFGLFAIGYSRLNRGAREDMSKNLVELSNAIEEDLSVDSHCNRLSNSAGCRMS
jgi:hypothetical protein